MSAPVKKYDRRQDAVITDCFVVMPEGVTNDEGNRRYCRRGRSVFSCVYSSGIMKLT